MMDSEMANGYIKYLKEMKVNAATPRNYEAELEKELSLSNPKTVRSSSFCRNISFAEVKNNGIGTTSSSFKRFVI